MDWCFSVFQEDWLVLGVSMDSVGELGRINGLRVIWCLMDLVVCYHIENLAKRLKKPVNVFINIIHPICNHVNVFSYRITQCVGFNKIRVFLTLLRSCT